MSLLMRRTVAGAAWVVASFMVLAGVSRGGDDLWQTDFEAAKVTAKADHKLLLVEFTGSDWCVWCKKLRTEVFDKDEFKAAAPQSFVLVELDYPMHTELSAELKKQNDELRTHYKIHGYPAVLMMDAAGQVVAQTGYKVGGPENYLKQLDGFVKSYEEIVALKGKAETLAGVKRAKALDVIVSGYDKLGADNDDVTKYSAEIVALDPDNKAGLKLKYTFRIMLADAKSLLEAKKYADAKAGFEKAAALQGITAEQQQDAYFAEGQCFFGTHDFAGLVALLTKARDVAPDSPKAKEIEPMLKRFEPVADAQETFARLKPELEKAQGLDRAKLLDQLIEAQDKFSPFIPAMRHADETAKWSKEIIALDPDNQTGLKTKYRVRELLAESAKSAKAGDMDKARAALEKALAVRDLTDDQKSQVQAAIAKLSKRKADKA